LTTKVELEAREILAKAGAGLRIENLEIDEDELQFRFDIPDGVNPHAVAEWIISQKGENLSPSSSMTRPPSSPRSTRSRLSGRRCSKS
jgi:hypothetical protein